MSEGRVAVEPVRGWRLWHVSGSPGELRLASWIRGSIWPPAARFEARCRRHEAPSARHRCGIYALRDRSLAEDLLRSTVRGPLAGCRAVAVGSVSLWGHVIPHEDGWRAEFAYPYDLVLLNGHEEMAAELRDRYAVDVVAQPSLA